MAPGLARLRTDPALLCLPGICIPLIAGVTTGNIIPALAASTGALVVGFGALQVQFADPRSPMLAVAIGASISAGIGTLANAWLPAEAFCTMLWAPRWV